MNIKTQLAIGAAIAALTAQAAVAAGQPELVKQSLDHGRHYVTGELLVQFRAEADVAARKQVLDALGARRIETVVGAGLRGARGGDLDLVRLPASVSLEAAMDRLNAHALVDFAEPNWIYTHQATSNDTYYTNGSLWGMYGDATSPANVYGSQAGEAWAAGKTCNSSIIVGIIDEGYMYSHEDLAANAWINPNETSNGRDDDGNGYVDDIYGWDFAGGDNTVFDGAGDDHGTHVAGTIAGVGGNGKGVAGVCWSAQLISAKFLGSSGGTTANAIKAVDYMTGLKTNSGVDIVATNNSWGGGGFSQGLEDAIARANDADILFVAAAGNAGSNNDNTANYPSNYDVPNVIAVASLKLNGALSSFSNYGATQVDLGAPGEAIWSTVPKKSRRTVTSGYASYSGTSMASPHVAGAVALYKSTHPSATAAQIKSAILSSTVATPSLSGKTVTGGRLNVSGY